MSIYDVFSGGSRAFNKEEWAAQKQEQRKEAYELIDSTCSEMMANGDSFRQYLDVQGHFDRYTVNNAILVSAQMPEATQLKDYGSWKQSRVYVDKDAQKVTILEPGKEYQRDDGSKAVGYNAKIVYDVSQTSANPRAFTRSIRASSLTPSRSKGIMKSSPYLRPWRTAHRATATMILSMRRMKKNLMPLSGSARSLPCMIRA